MRLKPDFFDQPIRSLARSLLGTLLVRRLPDGELVKAILVEVEAYLDQRDPASHSHRGPGKSNASMFLQPGTLYVYPIHTRHCMNVVAEAKGRGAAVLLRAAEPYQGENQMWRARFPDQPWDQPPVDQTRQQKTQLQSVPSVDPSARAISGVPFADSPPIALSWRQAAQLTQGPGRLCEALRINREQDGMQLCRSDSLWLETPPDCVGQKNWRIRSSPRIGISKAKSLPLRWFIDGHRFVSGCSRDHSQGRHWTFQHDGLST